YDHVRTDRNNSTAGARPGRNKGQNRGHAADGAGRREQNHAAPTSGGNSSLSTGNHSNGHGSQPGPLTVLKKAGNAASSWDGDPTCKALRSSSWADAPEFVPKSGASKPVRSYAAIVRPEGSSQKASSRDLSKEAALPLCPYEVASDGCPLGERCSYLHGELCDLCEKPCLHPFNEAQRKQHREVREQMPLPRSGPPSAAQASQAARIWPMAGNGRLASGLTVASMEVGSFWRRHDATRGEARGVKGHDSQ
ncbi:putative E3 ubiquitin-protein ligase makorin-1 isoform X1, partial [Ixodes scapularis]